MATWTFCTAPTRTTPGSMPGSRKGAAYPPQYGSPPPPTQPPMAEPLPYIAGLLLLGTKKLPPVVYPSVVCVGRYVLACRTPDNPYGVPAPWKEATCMCEANAPPWSCCTAIAPA
ncbi:hypothetical protein Vafri_1860 [Volvox africanus]|nr:hypothetical protein Vafri_1860 [Volvox africanus]